MEGGPSFGISSHRQQSHNKRTHSQMEAGHRRSQSPPLFVRQDSTPSDRASPPPPPPPPPHLPPNDNNPSHLSLSNWSRRYEGDGLDFRRPVSNMSNRSNTNVIDLTDEDDSAPSLTTTPQPEGMLHLPPRTQRLPRYSREIIDLSADTSPPEPSHASLYNRQEQQQAQDQTYPPRNSRPHAAAAPDRSSPEVQFVSARQRSPRSRIQERQLTPFQDLEHPVLDLTEDADDEVQITAEIGRTGVNLWAPQQPLARPAIGPRGMPLGRLADRLFGRSGHRAVFRRLWDTDILGVEGGEEDDVDMFRMAARMVRTAGVGRGPAGLDYTTAAFGLGMDDTPPRAPTPKYSPPPDPGIDFTRTPQEDDVLVCPNCQSELGIGKTDEKKQVWIVKACGHVYCGECMINRKNVRKGKAKMTDPTLPPPFKTCRAPGCDKPLNKNHVMQIFM